MQFQQTNQILATKAGHLRVLSPTPNLPISDWMSTLTFNITSVLTLVQIALGVPDARAAPCSKEILESLVASKPFQIEEYLELRSRHENGFLELKAKILDEESIVASQQQKLNFIQSLQDLLSSDLYRNAKYEGRTLLLNSLFRELKVEESWIEKNLSLIRNVPPAPKPLSLAQTESYLEQLNTKAHGVHAAMIRDQGATSTCYAHASCVLFNQHFNQALSPTEILGATLYRRAQNLIASKTSPIEALGPDILGVLHNRQGGHFVELFTFLNETHGFGRHLKANDLGSLDLHMIDDFSTHYKELSDNLGNLTTQELISKNESFFKKHFGRARKLDSSTINQINESVITFYVIGPRTSTVHNLARVEKRGIPVKETSINAKKSIQVELETVSASQILNKIDSNLHSGKSLGVGWELSTLDEIEIRAGRVQNTISSTTPLSHAMVIVGRRIDKKGTTWYTIANSWGQNNGLGGFFEISREALVQKKNLAIMEILH